MNPLQQSLIIYTSDISQNRFTYSTNKLQEAKDQLKQAYSILKEENSNLHQNSEFMKSYRSAHGIIQHELKMRKDDGNESIASLVNGAGKGYFQGSLLTRIQRQLAQGDRQHTPAEYLRLCDRIENGVASEYLNQQRKDVVRFREFIQTHYQNNYQAPLESLGSRMNQVEQSFATNHGDSLVTYNENTAAHNLIGDLNSRRREDISGLLRETSLDLRLRLAGRKVRFNSGMGIPVNFKVTRPEPKECLVNQVKGFFNGFMEKYFPVSDLQYN